MGWFRESKRHSLASRGIGSKYGKKDASKRGAKQGGLRRNKTTNCRNPEQKTDLTVLKGGLAEGKKPSKYNKKQLEKGTEIELEHTNNRDAAQRIAMDHLEEHTDYYKELQKMEKKLTKREKREQKRQDKLKGKR